jgi:hypothetical protein
MWYLILLIASIVVAMLIVRFAAWHAERVEAKWRRDYLFVSGGEEVPNEK